MQANYCSLAYFSAAFNIAGVVVALVTRGFAMVNVASTNPVAVITEIAATVFNDFDTVLELL